MVTFDARQAGTPAAAWDAGIGGLPEFDLGRFAGLLVVAAHPDDETLGAGGAIRAMAASGRPVHVVVATGGAPDGDRATIATRRTELHAALRVLAPEARVTAWDHPDAATGAHRDELRADLEALVAGTPRDWLVLAPWAGDGHHDHRVVGELVAEVAADRATAAYPIWMWHWAAPDDERVPWPRLVRVAGDAGAKREALDRYVSQTAGEDPLLRPELLAHFLRDQDVLAVDALPGAYFDALYARRDDPWGFETRWYERRKRDLTLASLPAERYATGLELGCSIGVLTDGLADRVDDLLAVDISEAALDRARARVGDRARFARHDLRDGIPGGSFDVVVVSEVGYYLTRDPLRRLLARVRDALTRDGVIVACHWRHPVRDYPLTGDEVHAELRALDLAPIASHVERDLLIDVVGRDPRSVAERAGLA
ncbi:PIG-L family deacetylase [Pseudolysinimonas sp.]|uniref:PIG-L family deacetylase n=1 Tax=Pseudolysinimonas sp. TaxID=2680009 RepID=UPI003F7F46FC